MKTVSGIGTATLWCQKAARKGRIVFIPTMGALHEGHAALIRRARRIAGKTGSVVVSIFVNPTQFGPREDLSRYPRPFAQDQEICKQEGVDLLFHPTAGEMYASDASITVSESKLSAGLCGTSRPGHFNGVCTVVAMLFQIIRPDTAIFGEKDWQQLAIIRRMVRDLKMPVTILGHPTVREEDGLALSSRNLLLSPSHRLLAPRIYQALIAIAMEAEYIAAGSGLDRLPKAALSDSEGRAERAQASQSGEISVAKLCRNLLKDLRAIPGAEVDYAEIVNEETLEPLKKIEKGIPARAFVAVKLGSVRLIDNVLL